MSSDCEGRTQEDIGKDIEEWRATEIINLEDEEAKEDFADQIGISLKIAKRGIPKSKVS